MKEIQDGSLCMTDGKTSIGLSEANPLFDIWILTFDIHSQRIGRLTHQDIARVKHIHT
jgi:hypothetical protein